MSVITRLAPPSLQGYQRSWLPRDIVAGVTLAAVVIPETMARSLQRAAAPRMGSGVFHVVERTFVPGSYTRAAGWLIPNGPSLK